MRDGLRSAIAAIGFLTVAPVGRRATIEEADLRRGVLLFPLVGAAVGAVAALIGWSTSTLVGPFVASVLAVAAGAFLTGLLHLDGLGDTADGVGATLSGGDPRAAMSDPRSGTFGAVAVMLDLLLRVGVLAAFLGRPGFPWAVVATGALARSSVLGLSLVVPYAGTPSASGSWTASVDRGRCVVGLAVGAAIGVLAVGPAVVPMVLVGAIVCFAIGGWSSRHLGGMRGDTHGAAIELTDCFALLAALAAT